MCLVFSEVPGIHWGTKFTVSKLSSSSLNENEGPFDSKARQMYSAIFRLQFLRYMQLHGARLSFIYIHSCSTFLSPNRKTFWEKDYQVILIIKESRAKGPSSTCCVLVP